VLPQQLEIGGVRLSLTCEDESVFLPMRDGFRAFTKTAAGDRQPDIRITAAIGQLPELEPSSLSFDSDRFWVAHRERETLAFACRDLQPTADFWRVAVGHAAGDEWHVTTTPRPSFVSPGERYPDALVFPVAELILLNYLATRGGGLLHACGVAHDGQGYMFCGRSGAGKSTTAQLWDGLGTVLNDDRTLLRRASDGSFSIHGTPWHGDFSNVNPGSAPLTAVFFLEQAERNYTERVTPFQAQRQLLTSGWLPLWDRSVGLPQTLELYADVAHRVPAYRLGFRPEAGARQAVLDAVAQIGSES
jgi:hypothetical protein